MGLVSAVARHACPAGRHQVPLMNQDLEIPIPTSAARQRSSRDQSPLVGLRDDLLQRHRSGRSTIRGRTVVLDRAHLTRLGLGDRSVLGRRRSLVDAQSHQHPLQAGFLQNCEEVTAERCTGRAPLIAGCGGTVESVNNKG